MRNRRVASWLAVWPVAFAMIAGCGGGSHHAQHKAGHWRIGTHAPVVVTGGQQSAGGSAHPPGWGLPPKGTTLRPKAVRPSSVATAEQWDTITVATVPHGARYLAGYTSGFWPTFFQLVKLPWSPHVTSIAISASHHAQCLDIEPGDATPAQAATWYFAVKNDPGMRGSLIDGKPCEYSSFWEFVNQVNPVLRRAGIADGAIWKWDANFTFRQHLDQGFACTQWSDKALGLNLDESTCTLAFLGFHPHPKPKPVPPKPRHPYPANLMTSTENATLASWYDHHCTSKSRAAVCVRDRAQAKVFAHNIWVARQKDKEPWGYRNRGIRFHVLELVAA